MYREFSYLRLKDPTLGSRKCRSEYWASLGTLERLGVNKVDCLTIIKIDKTS